MKHLPVTRHKTSMFLLAILMFSAITSASAVKLYTTADGDGSAGRDASSNPNYYWADTSNPKVGSDYYIEYKEIIRGVAIIDITSLAGQTLGANSATFNFYSFGYTGTQLHHYNSDPGTTVTSGFWSATGTVIADLDNVEGWKSYDVTSLLQSDINNGFKNVGFIFPTIVNTGSGSFAGFEDVQGRGAYLDIAAVPEPASIIALAGGLIGLVSMRRRRV